MVVEDKWDQRPMPRVPFLLEDIPMCLKDLLAELQREGLTVSESQVRWAVVSGKITRPPLDGSLRFVFGEQHLDELRRIFGGKTRGP